MLVPTRASPPLMQTQTSDASVSGSENTTTSGSGDQGKEHNVMDDLVNQLAALESKSASANPP